jgi:hypothetical protein
MGHLQGKSDTEWDPRNFKLFCRFGRPQIGKTSAGRSFACRRAAERVGQVYGVAERGDSASSTRTAPLALCPLRNTQGCSPAALPKARDNFCRQSTVFRVAPLQHS